MQCLAGWGRYVFQWFTPGCCRPFRGSSFTLDLPGAYAPGFIFAPLRGLAPDASSVAWSLGLTFSYPNSGNARRSVGY